MKSPKQVNKKQFMSLAGSPVTLKDAFIKMKELRKQGYIVKINEVRQWYGVIGICLSHNRPGAL